MKYNEQNVNLSAGRPDSNMTDQQWQQIFTLMKSMVRERKEEELCYSTSDESYCSYIESVLSTIRGDLDEEPEHDYCYFIYQIATLLEFERERLRTKYLEEYQCFEVWLD